MSLSPSERSRLFSKPHQEPESILGEKESIRLHTEFGIGVSDIAMLINSNKPTVLRWLKRSGAYKGRSKRVSNIGSIEVLWRDERRTKSGFVYPHQRRAWELEWRGADMWDQDRHWVRHIDRRKYFYSKQTKAKRRLDPNFDRLNTVEMKQSRSWRLEWVGADRWDENAYWHKHPAKKRFLMAKSRRKLDKTNIQHRTARLFRNRMREALRLQLAGKHRHAKELAGCSWGYLVQHIQSQFRSGMTWENHGTYWQIDHIRPCASFDLKQPEEQDKCFHYTNLQPLTTIENQIKSDSWNCHDVSSRPSSSS